MAALWCCLLPGFLWAATFTASLDRDTTTLGENVTLSLSFTGGTPNAIPTPPDVPNLQISYGGQSSQISFVNGQSSSSISYNFTVAARQPGDYVIPALSAVVGGQTLSSQPLALKVLKPNAPPPEAISSGAQLVFLKLVLPKKELYVGETAVAQLNLYILNRVQGIRDFQLTAFPADGFNVGKLVEGQRRQTQIGNAVYTVIPLSFTLKAIKTGAFTLGPVTAGVLAEVASGNRRRDVFDPFGMFGSVEQKQVTLATEAEKVQALALPPENVPPSFNGTIGRYTMTVTAGPTNVAVGDPITVRIQITGRGSLDSLTLPDQPAWRDFKTYPPTAKVDTGDAFGLQGTKTFEQIVVPEKSDIKALPPVSFSFFDPDQKAYRTLSQPATPLVVRPAGEAAAPTALVSGRSAQDTPPPAQDIVPNKPRLGALAQIRPPLVQQPWFLALQGVPVLALIGSIAWRKRAENLAHNPRLRRQRHVAHVLRDGLAQLRQLAAANQSDEFFVTFFRLLQEQLGERLDLPASAITEAVIEERLRPKHVPEATIGPLQELFQTCNLARYAPIKSSQQLAALIPKLEAVLGELRNLEV